MKRFYNFIFFVLILFMFFGINNVLATGSVQMQEIEQNIEQIVDKTKKVDSMGIYKMPDDLTYSDSSKIYLRGGVILFKFEDDSYQLIDMMSKDIVKSVNFDGDSSNIIINFSYDNVMINGNVTLEKSVDYEIHNTVLGAGGENPIRGFDIKVAPKYSYIQNYEDLDLRRGVLDIFYEDGTLGVVKMTDPEVVVEGFNNKVPGIQELTVRYKGFEKKFNVNILENYNPELNGKLSVDRKSENNNNSTQAPKFVQINTSRGESNSSNNNSSNFNSNVNKNGQNRPDNTMAKGLLPQTGAIPIVLFSILFCTIVLIIIYIKNIIMRRGIRGI